MDDTGSKKTANDIPTEEVQKVAITSEPETQSKVTQSVQKHVNKESEAAIAERRKMILEDAKVAVEETRSALAALDADDKDKTIAALTRAIGKVEMILARNPLLTLAPVEVNTVIRDSFAGTDMIKPSIDYAKRALKNGEVQKARRLLTDLASEISIQTLSLPLATYPMALKAVVPMIDSGNVDAAKMALQTVLGTLVVTEDRVIPLPVIRSRAMLEEAESLAASSSRNDGEQKRLQDLLDGAKKSLELAEMLGYGHTRRDYKDLFEQLQEVEKRVSGNRGGKNIS